MDGNAGLDSYKEPASFWIGDTEVTKDDAFTSVKHCFIGDMHLIIKSNV